MTDLLTKRQRAILLCMERAFSEQQAIAQRRRGGNFGIAVDKDDSSLRWQVLEFRYYRARARLMGDMQLPGGKSYVGYLRCRAREITRR